MPTQVYHPNIDLEGHVCLNILRDEWKPVLDINTVIYGIIYLFYEPNPNDPLNHGESVRQLCTLNAGVLQCVFCVSYLYLHTNACEPGAEAAALFRDNKDAFKRNVESSLRGGHVSGVTFPRLLPGHAGYY
jgi:ubiquitin-protein ligase